MKLPNYYRVLEILQTSIHTGILPILLSRHYTEFIHASIMKRIEDIQIQLNALRFHPRAVGPGTFEKSGGKSMISDQRDGPVLSHRIVLTL